MASPSSSPVVTKQLPADFTGQAACEAAKVLGILAGFGLLPLLRARIPEYLWIAGLVGGILALAAGLYHAARLWGWPRRPAKPGQPVPPVQPLVSLGSDLFLP